MLGVGNTAESDGISLPIYFAIYHLDKRYFDAIVSSKLLDICSLSLSALRVALSSLDVCRFLLTVCHLEL